MSEIGKKKSLECMKINTYANPEVDNYSCEAGTSQQDKLLTQQSQACLELKSINLDSNHPKSKGSTAIIGNPNLYELIHQRNQNTIYESTKIECSRSNKVPVETFSETCSIDIDKQLLQSKPNSSSYSITDENHCFTENLAKLQIKIEKKTNYALPNFSLFFQEDIPISDLNKKSRSIPELLHLERDFHEQETGLDLKECKDENKHLIFPSFGSLDELSKTCLVINKQLLHSKINRSHSIVDVQHLDVAKLKNKNEENTHSLSMPSIGHVCQNDIQISELNEKSRSIPELLHPKKDVHEQQIGNSLKTCKYDNKHLTLPSFGSLDELSDACLIIKKQSLQSTCKKSSDSIFDEIHSSTEALGKLQINNEKKTNSHSMPSCDHFCKEYMPKSDINEKSRSFPELLHQKKEVHEQQPGIGFKECKDDNKHLTFPSFGSLDELSEILKYKEQSIYHDNEKIETYMSVSSFRHDQAATTDNISLNRNTGIQNELVGRRNYEEEYSSEPPPYSPYDTSNNVHQDQNRSAPVQVYYYQEPLRDAGRAPPYQVNDPRISMNIFDDILIRKQFVAKVYTILSIQLLATFSLVVFVAFYKPAKLFFLRNYFLNYIVALCVYITIFIAFVCCQYTRRVVPLNYILLMFFTIAMAILAATVTSVYSTYIVMLSLGVTTAVCFVITFIACLPCFDITGYFIYLFIFGIIVMIYGFIAIIVSLITHAKILYMIYAALITILFSLYLIFDTQQLLTGKRFQLSPEEYIFGAISLYVDIVTIFLSILTLCGDR